jgi:hypothetical protein
MVEGAAGSSSADDLIRLWWKNYRRDNACIFREIDDWYEQFRRDFVPSRSGKTVLGVNSAQRTHAKETLFRDLVLVGHGEVTNEKCGGWRGWVGCCQVEKHPNHDVFVRPYYNSCDRPQCPECYRSWAVRLGWMKIAPRLLEASKLFDSPVEHIICSLPKDDYDLAYREAKHKAEKILDSSGEFGGVILPHGNRIDKSTGIESFSPHFHSLGFLDPRYERCRRCKGADCYSCDGVEGKCYRVFRDTGYIVKVMPEERRTVGGTAFYEASHASTDISRRGFRVAVWFGRCGYSNLGVKFEKPRYHCPQCGSDCGFLEYVGSRRPAIDKGDPKFKPQSFEPFLEDGKPAWVVREFKSSGGFGGD